MAIASYNMFLLTYFLRQRDFWFSLKISSDLDLPLEIIICSNPQQWRTRMFLFHPQEILRSTCWPLSVISWKFITPKGKNNVSTFSTYIHLPLRWLQVFHCYTSWCCHRISERALRKKCCQSHLNLISFLFETLFFLFISDGY